MRPIDLRFIDNLVDIGFGAGYVLEFSNSTFADFFEKELNVDICDSVYLGGSKGKRLRKFFELSDTKAQVKTLDLLWEYRSEALQRRRQSDPLENAHGRFLELRNRLLSGSSNPTPFAFQPKPAFDRVKAQNLRAELQGMWNLNPQNRGYEFEKFLKSLFNCFGLEAKEAFRITGEQIDGSFQLGNETYIVEAKWTSNLTGADQLHVFHGKIEQKASWARGLFISYTGFTDVGLSAFGRAKRLICMDGLDLDDLLRRELPINHVLEKKIRGAAETGEIFIRVRDLFPE